MKIERKKLIYSVTFHYATINIQNGGNHKNNSNNSEVRCFYLRIA